MGRGGTGEHGQTAIGGRRFSPLYGVHPRRRTEPVDPVPIEIRTQTMLDGTVVTVYRRAGELHRSDGPAMIKMSANGKLRTEGYYRYGVQRRERILLRDGFEKNTHLDPWGEPHRIGGPAMITTYADGAHDETWYEHGVGHRADGPAFTQVNADSSRREEHIRYGDYHRTDGPAVEERDPDGNVTLFEYKIRSKLHRLDGPATVYFDDVHDEHVEIWCVDGERHRDGAPALIRTAADGVINAVWYRHGEVLKTGSRQPSDPCPHWEINEPDGDERARCADCGKTQ